MARESAWIGKELRVWAHLSTRVHGRRACSGKCRVVRAIVIAPHAPTRTPPGMGGTSSAYKITSREEKKYLLAGFFR